MTDRHPLQSYTTSYYNGACPICRHEMMRYKSHAEAAGATLGWVDISKAENQNALKHLGVTQDMAYRRIYVVDSKGTPAAGVDGLALIWAEIPRWRWAAAVTQHPLIIPVARFVYDQIVAKLIYEWNRRRLGRCPSGVCVMPQNPSDSAKQT